MLNEILQRVAEFVLPWLMAGMEKWPFMATVVGIMGTARLVLKPIFSALPKFVDTTPWEWDNALLQKVLNSKAYPVVAWLFDYIASIKLPKKPEAKEAPKVDAAPAA